MKIKNALFICLTLAILPLFLTTTPHAKKPTINNMVYLPILTYQKMLSSIMCNFMANFLQKTTDEEKDNNPQEVPVITDKEIPSLAREEVLQAMKIITTKVFDVNDAEDLSVHLLALKALCQQLDPETDQKTIDVIHFLLANQHKFNISDLLFWSQARKNYDFKTAIPMTPEDTAKEENTLLTVFYKKMKLQAEKRKKEQLANKPILVDQAVLVA